MNEKERTYHVVAINERTGAKTYMTSRPDTQQACLTILSKMTKYEWRRNQLEDVAEDDASTLLARELGVVEAASGELAQIMNDVRAQHVDPSIPYLGTIYVDVWNGKPWPKAGDMMPPRPPGAFSEHVASAKCCSVVGRGPFTCPCGITWDDPTWSAS